MPTACLRADDFQLGFQRLDAPAAIFHFGRHRVLADGDAGAGGVEQADRLVRQLARRNVAMRELDGRFERFVENLHAVMLLHASKRRRASSGAPFLRSAPSTCTTWKRRVSAGSFSMCFLYSAQVVAAMVRSVPRASAGLSRLAASPVPAAPPAPISVWASSMNRMIGLGDACTSSMTCAQALFEFAFHARAGLQQADVERAQR